MQPTPGVPRRKGEQRRKDRVMKMLHTLPEQAQDSIIDSLSDEERQQYGVRRREMATVSSIGDTQQTPRSQPGTLSGELPEQQVAQLPKTTEWRGEPQHARKESAPQQSRTRRLFGSKRRGDDN
jgi:phospholipid/cholesterol/gamma-HCH transport system ATP-binding protein